MLTGIGPKMIDTDDTERKPSLCIARVLFFRSATPTHSLLPPTHSR